MRRDLRDWLIDLELIPAGGPAEFNRYIEYYEPYATSHEALDGDLVFMEAVRNAARTLMESVGEIRRGRKVPGADVTPPRPK